MKGIRGIDQNFGIRVVQVITHASHPFYSCLSTWLRFLPPLLLWSYAGQAAYSPTGDISLKSFFCLTMDEVEEWGDGI